jgi:hypothetical protein
MTKNDIGKMKLPSCWRLLTAECKPDAFWIDFWTAMPLGDDFLDYVGGDFHGGEVFQFARETDQPEWVDCTIAWISLILLQQRGFLDPLDKLEQGFFDRVRRDDPEAFDRIVMRIFAMEPQLRH